MENLKLFVESQNQTSSFKDIKAGDTIYGIKLPHERNPKAKLIEGTVKDIKIGKDSSEYYGGSEIKFEVNGKISTIVLWEREFNNKILTSGRSKFFLTKEERDLYYKEYTPKDIESINNDFKYMDEMSKKKIETEKNKETGEFKSLEEEIAAIKDKYDHEFGSIKANAEADQKEKEEIEAAKKKWENK